MNLLICKICQEKFESRFSNKNTCNSVCNRKYRNIQRNRLKNRLKKCKYCEKDFLGNSTKVLCEQCSNTRRVVNKRIKVTYLCPKCNNISYVGLAKTGQSRIYTGVRLCKECKNKIQHNKDSQSRIHSIRTSLYKPWILPILERDNFTCRNCHKTNIVLEVHHDKETFSSILKRVTNRKNLSEVSYKNYINILHKVIKEHKKASGITLCTKCHIEVDPRRH